MEEQSSISDSDMSCQIVWLVWVAKRLRLTIVLNLALIKAPAWVWTSFLKLGHLVSINQLACSTPLIVHFTEFVLSFPRCFSFALNDTASHKHQMALGHHTFYRKFNPAFLTNLIFLIFLHEHNIWPIIPLPVPNWASAEAQFIPKFSLAAPQIF